MTEKKWDGIRYVAFLVYEMDFQWLKTIGVDCRLKMRHLVDVRFRLPPIEFISPVRCKLFDICK